MEVIARFELADISLDAAVVNANEKLSGAFTTERDDLAISIIYDFINGTVYVEDSN